MADLKTLDDLKDPEKMRARLKEVRKSKKGGQFVFLFSSKALDGAPLLLLSEPGKPVDKGLAQEAAQGGRPIRGSYQREEDVLVFFPREEVNKTRMHTHIIKISLGLKVKLPASGVEIRTPEDVQARAADHGAHQQGIRDRLESEGTRNLSDAALLGTAVGGLAEGLSALTGVLAVRRARSKLKDQIKAGFPLQPLTPAALNLPEIPEQLQARQGAEDTPLEQARSAARVAAEAARQAQADLETHRRALDQLVMLCDEAMISATGEGGPTQRITEQLHLHLNAISRAEQILAEGAREQEMFELTRDATVQGDWTEEARERLAALQEESQRHKEALAALDRADSELRQEIQAAETAQRTAQADCRARWAALNVAEERLTQFDANRERETQQRQRDIQDAKKGLEKARLALESARKKGQPTAELENAVVMAMGAVTEAEARLGSMDQERVILLEALQRAEAAAEQAEDQLRALDDRQPTLLDQQLSQDVSLARAAEQEAEARAAAAEQALAAYGQQRAALLAVLAGPRLSERQAAQEALAQLEAALQAHTAQLEEARKARDLLQSQMLSLQTDMDLPDLDPEERLRIGARLAEQRSLALQQEEGLTTLQTQQSQAEQAVLAQQHTVRTLETAVLQDSAQSDDPQVQQAWNQLQDLEGAQARAQEQLQDALLIRDQATESREESERRLRTQPLFAELQDLLDDPRLDELRRLDRTWALKDKDKALQKFQQRVMDIDAGTPTELSKTEALARKLGRGPARTAPVDPNDTLSVLLQKLTAKTEALRESGGTPEQLIQVWEKFPAALIPDRYVRDLQSWARMQTQLSREMAAYKDTHKPPVGGDGFKNSLAEATQKLADQAPGAITSALRASASAASPENITAISQMLVDAKVLTENIPADLVPVIGPVLQISAALATLGAVAYQGTLSKDGNVLGNAFQVAQGDGDPIEKLILQEKLVESIETLVKTTATSGLSLAGMVLPFIGAAAPSIDAIAHTIEALKRTKLTVEDTLLKRDAKALDSTLTDAVGQSRSREVDLVLENALHALGKGANAAGKITTDIGLFMVGGDGGATAATGLAINITGTVVYYGTTVVAQVKSWKDALSCWNMCRKAQNGDRQAQKDIFKHSGKYAKGIIALMAKENDPVALSYIKSRGLTPEMIEKSSPEIIRMYLLRRSGEGDFSQERDVLDDAVDGILRVAGWTANSARSLKQRISDYTHDIDRSKWEDFAPDHMDLDLSEIAQLAGELKGQRQLLRSLDPSTPRYAEAQQQLHTLEQDLASVRVSLLHSLSRLQPRLEVTNQTENRIRLQLQTVTQQREQLKAQREKIKEDLKDIAKNSPDYADKLRHHLAAISRIFEADRGAVQQLEDLKKLREDLTKERDRLKENQTQAHGYRMALERQTARSWAALNALAAIA